MKTSNSSKHGAPAPTVDWRRSARSLGIAAAVLGGVLLAAPQAFAQDAKGENSVRYERKSGKVKSKSNLDTKFKAAQKSAERDKNKQVEMMTADQFARQKEAVAREIADKQIGMLTRLIKATDKTDAQMPDYLFRLADHHLDKKAYFDRQAGALYEKIYAAEDKGDKATASQLKSKQKKFEKQANASGADAVNVYKVLVNSKQFSKYNRLDEALYFYAFELGQLGREAEMKEAYLRLIRDYPQSKYIANAYLSFADFYFNKNEIDSALKLYQKIVDGYKDSPVYAYALYKMGWCYLNPQNGGGPDYQQSLQKFVQTINATKSGKAGSEANARQLRRDARRDLVKAYVHAGKPSAAWGFFQKVGDGPKKKEDMSRPMMEILANAYFGEGMYVESSATYKTLQTTFSEDAERCKWQAAIVVNALASDDKQIQWKETQRLGEYWDEYKDSKFKKAVKKKCRDEARDTIQQMATTWHDEAEKTRILDTYDLSEKAYRKFMESFPKDKDAYEMNYYYAEILWAQAANDYNSKDNATKERGLKKFEQAHEEFKHVLERNPSGKYTKDAAYAQMLAMKNYLEYDETGGRSKACKVNTEGVCVYKDKKRKKKVRDKDAQTDTAVDFPESDYTDTEKKMLEAYDIYQKYVKDPKDKELPKIQFHRAKLMMEHNKFKEAKPVLIEILKKFDGSIYAAWSAEMLVDLLTISWTDKDNTPEQTVKASEELEEWALKLQKSKTWKHDETKRVREAVPTLLAGIGWKKAEAYQEQGKAGDPEGYVKCANQYLEVWNQFENHDRADILLFNAARCFEAAYLVGNAIKMRNELLNRYPDSEKYQQTLQEVAENYQAIAFYEKAAENMEKYADKYPKDNFTSEALQNAYLFRSGLGDEAKAQTNLNKYEDLYKKKDPKTAAKIYWSKHDLLETDEEKISHAKGYLAAYGKKGGADREAVAHAAIGQALWRQSCSKEGLYDSCLTVQRKKATAGEEERKKAEKLRKKTKKKKNDVPKYCGSATQGIITVHARDSKKAKDAQVHFSAVLKLASKAPNIPEDEKQRIEDYRNAVGMAMVYQADADYEEYLTVNIPDKLEFFVEEWKKDSGVPQWEKEYKAQVSARDDSMKRFKEFYDRKNELGAKLIKAYADVKKSASPFWTLAAAARTAVLSQNFADQLYRAEVPKSIKNEDMYFAYCDALADQAAGPEKMATDAFTYCLQRSTEFQFFNEFSRMCEEELQQRNPDEYPATNELFGNSIYTDSRLDVVGVQVSLEGDEIEEKKKKAPEKKDGGDKSGL